MLELKLAYKNLVSARLRTWLNVGMLSFTYVLIIWYHGMFTGMYRSAARDTIREDIAGGQYWCSGYDPYDPLTIEDSHGIIPARLKSFVDSGKAVPILIRQASIYPGGRIQSILIRGIEPSQKLLELPTSGLNKPGVSLPVMAGRLMAKRNSLKPGDSITIRWRDTNGTFDAVDGEIVQIMNTKNTGLDIGQLYIPISKLEEMTGLKNQATIIVIGQGVPHPDISGWNYKSPEYLLKDITDIVNSKKIGGYILYSILLFLSMLAIFDTQVLSIWRRRKEIGTLMALGMTRFRVVLLFTFEGMLNGILGIVIAAVYGVPILVYSATKGIPMPSGVEDFGFAISLKLFPVYSAGLIATTIAIIMITVTIVSYMPSRRISGLKPTEALKGKMS